MKSLTDQQKQWIVKDFKRRRRIERLIVMAGMASIFLVTYLAIDPRREIAGIGSSGLAVAALAIGVVTLALHLRNWRCPECNRRLPNHDVLFCRGCGAVFILDSGPAPAVKSKPSVPGEPAKQAAVGQRQVEGGASKPAAVGQRKVEGGASKPAASGQRKVEGGASKPAASGQRKVEGGAGKPAAAEAKEVAPAKKSLTPVQLWAVAAGANLTITWERNFDALALPQGRERAKVGLGPDWGLYGPADIEKTFNWLRHEGHSADFEQMLQGLAQVPAEQREGFIAAQDQDLAKTLRFVAEHGAQVKDGKLTAWDMVRLSFLARVTHTAGWLDEAAAWDVALEAARKLQRAYGSWSEMSENYLLGREFWGEASPESMASFRKNAAWLLTSERSPWTKLPWDLPLATVHPS